MAMPCQLAEWRTLLQVFSSCGMIFICSRSQYHGRGKAGAAPAVGLCRVGTSLLLLTHACPCTGTPARAVCPCWSQISLSHHPTGYRVGRQYVPEPPWIPEGPPSPPRRPPGPPSAIRAPWGAMQATCRWVMPFFCFASAHQLGTAAAAGLSGSVWPQTHPPPFCSGVLLAAVCLRACAFYFGRDLLVCCAALCGAADVSRPRVRH